MATAISSAVSNALSIIFKFWYVWIILFVIIFAILMILKRRKEDDYKIKEFEPPELKDVTRDGLKNYFNLMGINTKQGAVYRSFQKIADVKRYFASQGNFDIQYYDPKTKEVVTAGLVTKKGDKKLEETTKYDLIFVEAHNKFFLWRLLGLKPIYFILKWADDKGKIQLNFNPMNESIILDSKTDLTMYGDVWTNCEEGIDYITNISMIRLNERLQALLDSTPDKFTHLEMETAKAKAKLKLLAEAERQKYKEREEAGDTTII